MLSDLPCLLWALCCFGPVSLFWKPTCVGNFADPRGRVAVNIALRLWGMAPGPICGDFTVEMSENQGFLVSKFHRKERIMF